MQLARSELLEIVSAIEFFDRPSLDLVLKHIPSQNARMDDSDEERADRSICVGLIHSLARCCMYAFSDTRDPLSAVHPFYMLIETSGAEQAHDQEVIDTGSASDESTRFVAHSAVPDLPCVQKLNRFLERAMELELIVDGTLAQDTTQVSGK
jgi:hypothetical protein